jgi:large subunit ribosomal protein L10
MNKKEKSKSIEKLKEEMEKYTVIGVMDIHKMPSKQLQEIRKSLRGKAKLKVVKKIVLKYAIEGVKNEKIKELEDLLPTQPGLIFSDLEAFKLFSIIDNLRFKTFAKEGDTAEEDIWAYAGPTSLMAGPAISEFQQAGVPASIEGGKIKVRKDACVVKKGEEITGVKADVLRKLKVEPMEVLLKVVALYQNGEIFKGDVLELVSEYPKMLPKAFNNALNLSVHIVYPTKENIKYLLAKANQAANAISGLVGTENKSVSDEPKVEEKNIEEVSEEEKGEAETPVENGGAE